MANTAGNMAMSRTVLKLLPKTDDSVWLFFKACRTFYRAWRPIATASAASRLTSP